MCQLDMEKDNFFTQARVEPNYFTQNRCVNYNKSEFAKQQRKMYLTSTMSKIGLPHNYKGNNYVINY